jgi:hypothetical protein
MRDRIIGRTVWHGGKWYLRRRARRVPRKRRKAAIGVLCALVLIGVLAAQRSPSDR